MDIEQNYQRWLSSPRVSEEERKQLLSLSQEEKNDAFYRTIEFGTAGMRGLLGVGMNRVNIHTVGQVCVAFALHLLNRYENPREKGVVISHDNRYFSREFTLESARILNEMGFKVYIFDDLRPTPELSFAVRHYGCVGGVMVTASHNTKEYNGYKLYDETGCQLVPSKIQPVLDILATLPNELEFEVPAYEKKGETILIPAEVDDEYIRLVEGTQVHPELDKKGFKIIYSPQHGCSYESATRVFSELGYEIIPVKEQCVHDPNFGATLTPNPESPKAWVLILEYARREKAQLCVMTDPDGDRCGLGYLGRDGEYHLLTGNQSAALLLDYLLSERKKAGTLPENGVIYDTIVSSSLGREVAASYGVKAESFLTGFKFIGDRIHHYEELGEGPTFVFGYEESYGCLVGPFVRDKDGVQAILLYTEMALYHYRKGLTLGEAYDALEERFGHHLATTKDIYFKGMEGAATMKKLMVGLRENPVTSLAGSKVIATSDYASLLTTYEDGRTEKIENLPSSNVLKYFLSDKSTLAVRPSGTEPKVKFYIEAVGPSKDELEAKVDAIYEGILAHAGVKAE